MRLSIVIPAYNEEQYLGKCLESVFRDLQNSPNRDVEIVVVDNASSDRTSEIANSFKGVQVVYEPKKGLTRARNAGYCKATGDIIANVDSDSTLPVGWVERIFSEFSRDPNLVALSGPYIYPELSRIANYGIELYYRMGYVTHWINHNIFHTGAMLQGGNYVVRRSAMEAIGGFNLEFDFYGEDTDVARRIQKVGRVEFAFDFPMYTSSRRFAKEGIWLTGIRYVINYFWTLLFKKPFTRKFSDIRLKK